MCADMNEEQKQAYYTKYQKAKQKGVKFYPDIIYKDTIVSFGLFLLLVGLAIFVGVPNEPKADPNDTAYIPRPEWYFLFLFEMLKYFPGQIEWVGTAIVPAIGVLLFLLLPFIDRNPRRHWRKRRFAIAAMTAVVIGIAGLTILAAVTTPPQPESETVAGTITEQIILGEELYALHCVECHGTDGEGGEIVGVEGLEGVVVKPINSQDEMYTRSDQSLFDIIAFGQSSLGMPPYSKAFGGELGPGEIESIVAFMRYTWDDRVEIPQEAAQASAVPELAPDEIPSYEIHVQPIFKRYCLSCHRPGKKNGEYFMATYQEVMETGDNAPNVIPEDLSNNLIRMVHREEIEAGGPMPPTKALKPELIEILERWVLGGVLETADEAAAASIDSSEDAAPEDIPEDAGSVPPSVTPTPQP